MAMIHVFDIAQKDMMQILRDRRVFLFMLIMPMVFSLLLGFAFGAFSGVSDPRVPVAYLDEDKSWLSKALHGELATSQTIRLEEGFSSSAEVQQWIADKKAAAAIIVPAGFGRLTLDGKPARLRLIADTGTTAGTTIEADVLATANHIDSAVRTAFIMERIAGERMPFDYAFQQSLTGWKDPPIAFTETTSRAVKAASTQGEAFANISPGMMLQFAIAGLMTAAQVIVNERKCRALQRLLTTATARVHILLGHYLAILSMDFVQFVILILFGQLALQVPYFNNIGATLVMAFTSALCIAALGLLIGALARSEEQSVIFSLVPMFVFAGLGGAWVPLEATGSAFQAVGHLTPVAWAMDGFKNIAVRGFGFSSVLLPALVLILYAAAFFTLAAWRFRTMEEA
jgi:ABC-2 type transport system permease protein